MKSATPWVIGGVGILWLLTRPVAPGAPSLDTLRRHYAARLAAGDPDAGTSTLTALLGTALKAGLGVAATAIRKVLATGSEAAAKEAVTQYLQAPSVETLQQIAADLDVAYAPLPESPIPPDVTAGVEAGLPLQPDATLPSPEAVDESLQALDRITGYDPEQIEAATRGLQAAASGEVETGWAGADIDAALALLHGGEVPADVAAGLEIAYGAGAPFASLPTEITAGIEAGVEAGVGVTTQTESLLSALGPALRVAGIIGAAASIGFTIASDKPDMQKGVESAIDAASVAALWIPVYGWAVAAGAQAVKFLLGFAGVWGDDAASILQARRKAEATWWASALTPLADMLPQVRSVDGLVAALNRGSNPYAGLEVWTLEAAIPPAWRHSASTMPQQLAEGKSPLITNDFLRGPFAVYVYGSGNVWGEVRGVYDRLESALLRIGFASFGPVYPDEMGPGLAAALASRGHFHAGGLPVFSVPIPAFRTRFEARRAWAAPAPAPEPALTLQTYAAGDLARLFGPGTSAYEYLTALPYLSPVGVTNNLWVDLTTGTILGDVTAFQSPMLLTPLS